MWISFERTKRYIREMMTDSELDGSSSDGFASIHFVSLKLECLYKIFNDCFQMTTKKIAYPTFITCIILFLFCIDVNILPFLYDGKSIALMNWLRGSEHNEFYSSLTFIDSDTISLWWRRAVCLIKPLLIYEWMSNVEAVSIVLMMALIL